MRFVYYVDTHFSNKENLVKFEKETVERLAEAGFLRDDDVLVVIPRPGYISEIVALAGE